MNDKTIVFTVFDRKNNTKPSIDTTYLDRNILMSQSGLESIIVDWLSTNAPEIDSTYILDNIVDLVHSLMEQKYAWFGDRYCFELSEIS